MFRIRRIFDDTLPDHRRALADVTAILRTRFSSVADKVEAELPTRLRDPLRHGFRSIVFVAEKRTTVEGFAILLHAPDHGFAYLDFISASVDSPGRGIGAALYERVRDEARRLHCFGLFFECLPDEPDQLSDSETLEDNRRRLRFYEHWNARPLEMPSYRTPLPDGTALDLPFLVYDDLDRGAELARKRAVVVARTICERRYASICPPEYVEKVVRGIKVDPVPRRPPRYKTNAPRVASTTLPEDACVALFVNEKHDIHHVRERGYVESPVRIESILRALEPSGLFARRPTKKFPDAAVEAVHNPALVRYIKKMSATLPEGRSVYPYVFPVRNAARPPEDLATQAGYFCLDTFTPLHPNVWLAARGAVDCALSGAAEIRAGRRLAYALVRPPGHHAERRLYGGFCYFNNAAVAAHALSADGRVAILDVDYHHGNGQQDIFYRRADVLTVSLHGHPRFAYPYFAGFDDERGEGEGEGFNLNLPLPEKLDAKGYAKALRTAIDAVARFDPSTLVVCLGLDTARGDPTGTWELRPADFEANGRAIGALRRPTLVVQEGGYRTARLGAHALAFFRGLHATAG
ncbi:MAG: hypothetical protein R3B99_22000 [Polyangiales bacterium]